MAVPGVSPVMKRIGIVLALALAGGAVWFLQRPRTTTAASVSAPPPASAVATRAAAAAPDARDAPSAHRIDHVTRLDSLDQRRVLEERIRAAKGVQRVAPMPRLPPQEGSDEDATPISKTEIRSAMRDIVPHLAACYEAALPTLPSPKLSVVAELTLSGDPDVGTLIDAKQLVDKSGTPLPAKLDDCLRGELQMLALPPLAEGDHLEVRYPFEFRPN